LTRILAAQLARLGRRGTIWLLTAILVILNVLVARHNVDGVRTAQANLASASAGRVVRNCVVYGGYTLAGSCPAQTEPQFTRLRVPMATIDKQLARLAKCHSARCEKAAGAGQIVVEPAVTCSATGQCSSSSVSYAGPVTAGGNLLAVPPISRCLFRTDKCSSPSSMWRFSLVTTQQSQRQQIRQAVLASSRSLSVASGSLAPRHRVRLALSLLGSLPGLTLAVLLGAAAAGRGYRRKTWKERRAVARRQPSLLAARLAALWLATLGWIVIGVIATLATYAALAGGAHLAAWGMPAIPLPALLGTWLSLGLLASLSAAVSAAPRPAGLASAGGLASVPEALAEHE
jgi:hypothetical protein